MSATQLLLTPRQPAPAKAGAQPKTCRFAADCSCVFNRVAPAPVEALDAAASPSHADLGRAVPATVHLDAAPHNPALDAEVAGLVQRGFTIVSSDARQIVLQRRRRIPFCVNVALVAATVGLWAIQMAWRSRHPRIETVTLTLNPGSAPA
ncbi:hypothetical protein C5B96_15690 [Subtercola sp. Z020]|uniref:hypothetical protein n=1 Tax=Subtercola sp. Z020 TaxID=2080582 RepID=UPI000CE73696|nr:hypothetical protein [Subtercola sp. Z020]PPF77418.1 hypothetical protein C5B96_15690 [Subtercola sp. Z020]